MTQISFSSREMTLRAGWRALQMRHGFQHQVCMLRAVRDFPSDSKGAVIIVFQRDSWQDMTSVEINFQGSPALFILALPGPFLCRVMYWSIYGEGIVYLSRLWLMGSSKSIESASLLKIERSTCLKMQIHKTSGRMQREVDLRHNCALVHDGRQRLFSSPHQHGLKLWNPQTT